MVYTQTLLIKLRMLKRFFKLFALPPGCLYLGPWVVPAIMAAGQIVSTALQNRSARKNTELMNKYNSPANQMKRYSQAGLNPNLIYGQGTPGNQSAPTPVASYAGALEALPVYNQTRMVDAQVSAKNAETVKKQTEVEVAKVQKRLLEANPLLNNEGFLATLEILKSTAQMKTNESTISNLQTAALTKISGRQRNEDGVPTYYTQAAEKVLTEVDLLVQKFHLQETDLKIKAQILSGEEFRNAILEVQKRFMVDFDLSPQNWMQFVTILLQRAF